jgi:ferredoxin--NADP+ reductase
VKFGGTLWLLATGTGIAPFMSIIRYRKLYELFNKINVVWSVRQQQEVSSYIDFLPTYDIDLKITVTQDDKWNGQYNERITTLIENKIVLPNLDPTQDRVMICGNTEFNEDIKQILEANGFVEGNATTPGDYVVEKAFVG